MVAPGHIVVDSSGAIANEIAGTYRLVGERLGRSIFRGTSPTSGIAVLLYFWQDADDSNQTGWWFGSEVGGDQVWAFNPSRSVQAPPPLGWRVPWNGPVDRSFKIEAKDGDPGSAHPPRGKLPGLASKAAPAVPEVSAREPQQAPQRPTTHCGSRGPSADSSGSVSDGPPRDWCGARPTRRTKSQSSDSRNPIAGCSNLSLAEIEFGSPSDRPVLKKLRPPLVPAAQPSRRTALEKGRSRSRSRTRLISTILSRSRSRGRGIGHKVDRRKWLQEQREREQEEDRKEQASRIGTKSFGSSGRESSGGYAQLYDSGPYKERGRPPPPPPPPPPLPPHKENTDYPGRGSYQDKAPMVRGLSREDVYTESDSSEPPLPPPSPTKADYIRPPLKRRPHPPPHPPPPKAKAYVPMEKTGLKTVPKARAIEHGKPGKAKTPSKAKGHLVLNAKYPSKALSDARGNARPTGIDEELRAMINGRVKV